MFNLNFNYRLNLSDIDINEINGMFNDLNIENKKIVFEYWLK